MKQKEIEIALRAKEAIATSKLKNKEVAEAFGISPSSLSEALGGKNRVSALLAAAIAKMTGCSLQWIITGEDDAQDAIEITDEEIVRQILARPALRDQAISLAREQVHEKEDGYGGKDPVKKDLLKTYEHLPEKDRLHLAEYAQFLAHRNESRRKEGGGSNSAEENCA